MKFFVPPMIILIISFGFFSCKKNNATPPKVKSTTITSISPSSGGFGTTDTIKGTNFKVGDTVKFNGVIATVLLINDSTLIVTVPKAGGTGPVTVTQGGLTVTGPDFDYIFTIRVTTLAGNGVAGFADGDSAHAEFSYPVGVAVDSQGNVYVADRDNQRIRKITALGVVSTIAGDGNPGFVDSSASKAEFFNPYGVAVDNKGNVYVTDQENSRIRKITTAGQVSTFASNGTAGYVDGPDSMAEFHSPVGIVVDTLGNLFIADVTNNRIRKITPLGIVSTFAGNGITGYVDGPPTSAEFNEPVGLSIDSKENLYVADGFNSRIRVITHIGHVSTLAGDGSAGYADGPAASAEFFNPVGVVADSKGNVYVADFTNFRVRKIDLSGHVSTFAGDGKAGYRDGPPSTAEFNSPYGLAIDTNGNLYIADTNNNLIRKISIQ